MACSILRMEWNTFKWSQNLWTKRVGTLNMTEGLSSLMKQRRGGGGGAVEYDDLDAEMVHLEVVERMMTCDVDFWKLREYLADHLSIE